MEDFSGFPEVCSELLCTLSDIIVVTVAFARVELVHPVSREVRGPSGPHFSIRWRLPGTLSKLFEGRVGLLGVWDLLVVAIGLDTSYLVLVRHWQKAMAHGAITNPPFAFRRPVMAPGHPRHEFLSFGDELRTIFL